MESFVIAVQGWLARVREFIVSNPDFTLQIGQVSLLVALLVLYLALRSARVAKSARYAAESELKRLREELVTLREELSSGQQVSVLPVEPAKDVGVESVVSPIEPPRALQREVVAPSVTQPTESQISRGLKKSRVGLLGRLSGFFSGRSAVDLKQLDDLEELLILSDVGARCASDLVAEVKGVAEARQGGDISQQELVALLKDGVMKRLIDLPSEHRLYRPDRSPLVVLVVGVNGVGKTTTVAKLATRYMAEGKRVLAVAADTFRAAAVEQLAEWSSRVGFTLVRGAEGAKPSAVVFDGVAKAVSEQYDVVLIDTAGRLHTKSNLMQELEGVRNAIRKHVPDAPHETVLVLDGVSGQNALSQAREFNQAVSLTGIVVTKLDGTPKGGIIVAIAQELKLPVAYIGVGERVEDLIPFSRQDFVEALFDDSAASAERAVVNN
jgi:fused signal recognition particle receptor